MQNIDSSSFNEKYIGSGEKSDKNGEKDSLIDS